MPRVLIKHPRSYLPERQYIHKALLQEFLGLEFQAKAEDRQDTCIMVADDQGKLILTDVLFQIPPEKWLNEDSLPKQPLAVWTLPDAFPNGKVVPSRVPLIYGKPVRDGLYYSDDGNKITLGLDIFGSAFFMLTRYEEIVKPDRDQHDRFPAVASLAYQEGFLERPVVNEYLEILWACMKKLWPELDRKPRKYRLILSHDVDQPLSVVGKRWPSVLKKAAGDILRRKDIGLAARRLHARTCARYGDLDSDPHNVFDFIIDLSEQYKLQSAFYFITKHGANRLDGDYSIDLPWVRSLMRRIHDRGHEIGLHPSYNTYHNGAQMKREFEKLLRIAEEEGINQDCWGGRQHYLRWEAPTTWQGWEDAGLDYDSSLGYADHVGFRCGTCYEFPVFNLHSRQELALRERPLIVMEETLFGYMGLSSADSLRRILTLGEACKGYDGDFTLLWHNSTLLSGWQKRLYEEVLTNAV